MPGERSDITAAISRGVVRALKAAYGKGPVKARTYFWEDVVLIVLGGGFTQAEATLAGGGNRGLVREGREALHWAMAKPLIDVIEETTGRKVISFMSANDQAADLSAELFVLETLRIEPLEESSPDADS